MSYIKFNYRQYGKGPSHTDTHADALAHAFETLSAGRRFAVVPLADGGAFWFATCPALYPEGRASRGCPLRVIARDVRSFHPGQVCDARRGRRHRGCRRQPH